MFGVGPGELIVIILVALVVLGPEKLPAAARVLGRLTGEMRRLSTEFQRTLHEDAAPAPDPARAKTYAATDSTLTTSDPAPEPDALETANTVPADLIGVVDANTDKIAVSVAEPSVAEPSNDDPVAAASQTEERGRS